MPIRSPPAARGHMDYLDFELSVDARGDGEYEVSVRAPSGEARTRVRFPFTADVLAAQLRAVQGALEQTRAARDVVPTDASGRADAPRETVKQFGQTLFSTLLSGKVLVAWRTSGALAERDGHGLRLQLRLQAPEMAALPWELMFDPDDGSFVCLNPMTPLVRYPEIERAPELLSITLPLRVLAMMASPCNLPRLDKEAERSRIEKALKQLQHDRKVELTWMDGGTYRDLQAALRDGPWHVFHFIGHGGFEGDTASGGGVLALETTPSMAIPMATTGETPAGFTGPAHPVPAETVGQLLRGHPSLRLVLLNSCLGARGSTGNLFSSTAATLVRRGIPAVIAMQQEITDRAAVTFAQAFYTSLAAGIPVDRAVADARTAISVQDRKSVEWGTPVLLMRSPNGRLFSPAAPAEPGETVTPTMAETHGRTRVNAKLLALVATIPLVAAGFLGSLKVPSANVSLSANVSAVTVSLPAARALADPLDVTTLGVSGIASADVPGVGRQETDRILLTALDEPARAGRLTLNLTTRLQPGTRLSIGSAEEPESYTLALGDSVPDLSVAVVGPVKVLIPGSTNERVDFTAPGIIRLGAEHGTVTLDFQPATGARLAFASMMPADGIDLTRVERFDSPQGTEMREVSTIRSGRLMVGGGVTRTLEPGEMLRAGDLRGEITRLEMAGDHIELGVRGSAKRLSSGDGASRRDLMPSILGFALASKAGWILGALVLYLTLAGLAVSRASRRPA